MKADSVQRRTDPKSVGNYRLSKAELQAFHRDSILCLGQVFSAAEVAAVRAAFDSTLKRDRDGVYVISEGGSGQTRSVMGWENANPVLSHFARDARVLGRVQSVIGADVVFHQTKYNPKAPNGLGEKWDPHRGITFWHYLDGVPDPAKMISVFIALTEQTAENGATYTWMGAHNMTLDDLKQETDFSSRNEGELGGDTGSYLSLQIRPEKIAEYDRTFDKKLLEGPAGTVWLLDSRNLHASQPNLSSEVRILVANVYRSVANHPKHPRPSESLCTTSKVALVPAAGTIGLI
jgi:ectoine hydroxylase-related dioxygenase (phytanoyl-CoA dioxygenase family)